MDRTQLAAFIRKQEAVATGAELSAPGMGPAMVARRVAAGEWQRPLRGVYLLQPNPPDFAQRLAAVQKWAGGRAVFSHSTAGYLHGLVAHPPVVVEILLPHEVRLAGSARCKVRRTRRPIEARGAPPRTSIEDTVLDLINCANSESEVLELLVRGTQRRMRLDVFLERLKGRGRLRHRKFVLRVLAITSEGVESPLEYRYHRDVESPHGLPQARRQKWELVRGRWIRTDVWYEGYGVRTELDGQLAHPGRATDDDVMRDNDVRVALDEITLRYRWRHVHDEPCLVAAQVAAALVLRGWRGQVRRCSPACRAPEQAVAAVARHGRAAAG